jgi:hypothetical protein
MQRAPADPATTAPLGLRSPTASMSALAARAQHSCRLRAHSFNSGMLCPSHTAGNKPLVGPPPLAAGDMASGTPSPGRVRQVSHKSGAFDSSLRYEILAEARGVQWCGALDLNDRVALPDLSRRACRTRTGPLDLDDAGRGDPLTR